ncbi:hypothetical protein MSAN_00110600 [Mycena sanguinolenta]|uniref:DUF6534 domain-containing protein n=1 Tax=Mycena sanguinolenta TaxID=230812 RepID=A0A8H6ZDG3_9AGAR|nr:hypothetical protein MSAN_00110600 [Mycena sanguinolenta]
MADLNVTLLFGPMLIGVLLNTMLYGVMAVQAFIYYSRSKTDRPWFRYLVLYLVVADTANWVCDVGLIYEPLIILYGQLEALTISPLLLRADAILTVPVSTPVQLFIAWRILVVTRSYVLPGLIFILAMVSLAGGVATTIVVSIHPAFASFSHFRTEVAIWLISSTVCDIVLTASLVHSLASFYLLTARWTLTNLDAQWTRKTNIVATDGYINKIIRLSVQTGSITAAAALLDLIFFLAIPKTSFNFMVDFPLSKLYTNALISTLNARPWQEHISQHEAPNALFEQSNMDVRSVTVGQTNFAVVKRRTSQPGGRQSYVMSNYHPHPSKFRLDAIEFDSV